MPYEIGTDKYRHYWIARQRGLSRKEAEAYAEAQSAGVAAETEPPGTDGPEGDNADPEASVIPEDWRDLPWPFLRALASRLSDEPVHSRADAERVIEAAKS